MNTKLDLHLAERIRHCEVKSRAYAIWLGRLTPANLLFVVGAAVLSLISGASILQDFKWLTSQQAAFAAFLSTVFTIVHTKLKCDSHQDECRRLRALYDGIKFQFESARSESDETIAESKARDLDEQLSKVAQSAQAWPSARAESKAELQVSK